MEKKIIAIGVDFKEQDVQVMPSENYEEPELKIALAKENSIHCLHEHVRVWKHHRILQCRDCAATLDAFNHIVDIGFREGGMLSNRRWLTSQVKWLNEEIASLKKEIAKLKIERKKLTN